MEAAEDPSARAPPGNPPNRQTPGRARGPEGPVADGRFPTMLEPARTMAPRARFDKDYYRTMGLHPEATDDEIRRAYRRLALEWHPDRKSGDPTAAEQFK